MKAKDGNDVALDAVVRKPLWRAVFNPRNSMCASANVRDLEKHWWWTDRVGDSFYIHAVHRLGDDTIHRVRPKHIKGYTCSRIGLKPGGYHKTGGYRIGPVPYWIYDHKVDAPSGATEE